MYFCLVLAEGVGEEWPEELDTHSMITSTSDSGLGSHGAPSIIGEEVTSGQFFKELLEGFPLLAYILYIPTHTYTQI